MSKTNFDLGVIFLKRIAVWMMLISCVAVLAAPFQAAAATNSNVKIVIDGEALTLDSASSAFVEKNRTLVPVRGVFEQLGLEVDWNASAKRATIKGEDLTIEMKLGASQVVVNGQTTTVDVPVTVKQNRLFIPLRFVIEEAGLTVDWKQAERTVYLKKEQPGEFVSDTEAFLKDLIEANQDLTSYSGDFFIEQSMNMMGEEMEMDMNMQMDVVMDPLGLYQYMTMTMAEIDEEFISESYVTEDGFFVYDSAFDQWIQYDDSMYTDLLGMSETQMDPTAQFELMQSYMEDLKVYEQEDTYELHFELSGEGFQDLLDFILNAPDLGLEEEALEDFNVDFDINSMSIVTVLDKETLFPLSEKMDSDMTISVDGEEMNLVQHVQSSYSNHNEVEDIVIPQEVIDSAISFEEYLKLIEAEFGAEGDLEAELGLEFEVVLESAANHLINQ